MQRICLVCFIAVAAIAQAHASCSKPDAPYCVSSYGKFDDEWDFQRCRGEMESYKSDVESYLSCQKQESRTVVSDYNDAVESFNRRARGY